MAIVSGAASGIGLVSAQTFARNGACVILLDINAEGLTQAKATIKGPCLALVCMIYKEAANSSPWYCFMVYMPAADSAAFHRLLI